MPIRKTKSGRYKIDNVPGTYETRAQALRRLRAIKASQARKKG